jgi:anti-sigma-K factor RskA
LLVATVLWFTRPTTNQNSPMIAEAEPPTESAVVERRQTAAVVSTIAEQREQLLASAPDVLHLRLVNSDSGAVAREPGGDIVWSNGQQMGYLRLQGLASDEPAQRQYQLWIIGGDASSNDFINGGMFFVGRNTGELIVPIHADHFVQMPKMFLISVEPLGGGDALTTSLLAKADVLGP